MMVTDVRGSPAGLREKLLAAVAEARGVVPEAYLARMVNGEVPVSASPDPAIFLLVSDAIPRGRLTILKPNSSPTRAAGSPSSGIAPLRRDRTWPTAESNTPKH